MQTNNHAGIIIYRAAKVPQLFSSFSQPSLEQSLSLHIGDHEINISIFDCPVNGDKLDRKRYKSLRELIEKNKIKFLVECFEAKVQSNVTPKKNEPHYTQLMPEIRAMKKLAALIKLSQEKQENILAGSIAFILPKPDEALIDLLSEEAINVMVHEGTEFTEQAKLKLHHHFMEKKGVSIVFSKDIGSMIESSSIIVTEGAIDLTQNQNQLQGKVILGECKAEGIKSINQVILWISELRNAQNEAVITAYNDEILAAIKYFEGKLDALTFIKKFPYIYFE